MLRVVGAFDREMRCGCAILRGIGGRENWYGELGIVDWKDWDRGLPSCL